MRGFSRTDPLPPVVSFIGRPGSGKTTLLENLIPVLKNKGYRVGLIKHHVHEFEMDTPGKDTWRLKRAGAAVVALSSPQGLGVIRDTERDTSIEELVEKYFSDVDIVLTEGYKKAGADKVEIHRQTVHPSPLENRNETWAAVVSDNPLESHPFTFLLKDISGLADFLIRKYLPPRKPTQPHE